MLGSSILVVCGIELGDEAKGTTTNFLTELSGSPLTVRYNGGPQAGHNVVTGNGRWHCFAQFGSGTFTDNTLTYLSRYMLIEPEALFREAQTLKNKGVQNPLSRCIIDARATVITPAHKLVGQLLEISRGEHRLGSCGMGVGRAILDQENGLFISLQDFFSPEVLAEKLRCLIDWELAKAREILASNPRSSSMQETYQYFLGRLNLEDLLKTYANFLQRMRSNIDQTGSFLARYLSQQTTVIFEGAQGALLDRKRGFHPHITQSRTTYHNAADLLLGHDCEVKKIGVMRPYAHRHGRGPLVTEDESLTRYFTELHNSENAWQGPFRVGWLDLLSLRYGLAINDGVDALVLTNLDQLSSLAEIKICQSYEYRGPLNDLDSYFEWEPLGSQRAKITAIKNEPLSLEQSEQRTRILMDCRPLEFIKLPGWQQDITKARKASDLPLQSRQLISFLESSAGLTTPIWTVSVDPTSRGKILLR